MKSDLQIRAESAAERFIKARRPIVIEFAGVPKSGKSSTISALHAFLKRCGFKVEVVVERASVCPIRDKKHFNFNVWTSCTTLSQILEKTQTPPGPDDPHILILDRGLFDSICWLSLMERLGRISRKDRETIEKFLLIGDWKDRIAGVVTMTVNPADAMVREQGLLPVEGGKGSIMNTTILEKMVTTMEENVRKMEGEFQILRINTSESKNTPAKTAEMVADFVIGIIETHLEEEILSIPKDRVTEIFGTKLVLPVAETNRLIQAIQKDGDFRPRDAVERDSSRVQIIPVAIVRNKRGDILRLRRKERNPENMLHEKIVAWAGGHLRREDDENGHSLTHCVQRELQEELRLCVRVEDLKLLAAVYSAFNPHEAKHLAIVFEWRADTDEVEIALSTAEFFERRGTSLSGSFVSLVALARDVEASIVDEPWTMQIVKALLGKGQFLFSPTLF